MNFQILLILYLKKFKLNYIDKVFLIANFPDFICHKKLGNFFSADLPSPKNFLFEIFLFFANSIDCKINLSLKFIFLISLDLSLFFCLSPILIVETP